MKTETTTISLEINREAIKELTFDFSELPESLDIIFNEYNKIIVTNVPNEVEYELSKLIFNRAHIEELLEDNIALVIQVTNHIPYHVPKGL